MIVSKRSIKFRYLILVGAILVAFAPIFVFVSNAADPCAPSTFNYSQCKAKRDALAQQAQRDRELAAQKKKEAAELQKIIAQIDKNISNTQYKINQTQNQINDISAQIAQKEKELAIEQENQNEAIRVMYETTNQNTLEILIGSETLSEVVTYGEYLEALEIKIENTIAEIERLKKDLETQKGQLEELKTQQEAYRSQLNAEKDTKAKVLGWTRQEIKNYQEKIATAQEEINEINKSLERSGEGITKCGSWGFLVYENQYVERGYQIGWQGDSGFSTGSHLHFGVYKNGGWVDPYPFLTSGELGWPLNSPRITQVFGCTGFAQCGDPTGPYRGGPHPGIDLSVGYHAPVFASESGVVVDTVRSCSGYGDHIKIMGENSGLITLYAHLD